MARVKKMVMPRWIMESLVTEGSKQHFKIRSGMPRHGMIRSVEIQGDKILFIIEDSNFPDVPTAVDEIRLDYAMPDAKEENDKTLFSSGAQDAEDQIRHMADTMDKRVAAFLYNLLNARGHRVENGYEEKFRRAWKDTKI